MSRSAMAARPYSSDWLRDMQATNDIIQFSAERLQADRNKVTSVANEVMLCAQEAKLVKYFARILYLKTMWSQRCRASPGPSSTPEPAALDAFGSIDAWLAVVNVSLPDRSALAQKLSPGGLAQLVNLQERQLHQICDQTGVHGESRRRFLTATARLRDYTRVWLDEGAEPGDVFADADLAWISYDRATSVTAPRSPPAFLAERGRGDRRSVSESGVDSGASDSGVGSNVSQTSLPTTTPPPSPGMLLAPSVSTRLPTSKTLDLRTIRNAGNQPASVSSPKMAKASSSTPPPTLKWGTGKKPVSAVEAAQGASSIRPRVGSLSNANMTRSHSHESNLQNRIAREGMVVSQEVVSPKAPQTHPSYLPMTTMRSISDNLTVNASQMPSPDNQSAYKSAHATLLSPTSPGPNSGCGSPAPLSHPRTSSGTFGVPPKSPKTGRMLHSIPHVWHKRTTFRHLTDPCHVCQKPLGVFSEKCKSCKLKAHTLCKPKIGSATCGLTPGHVKEFLAQMFTNGNEDAWNTATTPNAVGNMAGSRSMSEIGAAFHYPDPTHDSSSSTNSSAPGTPAQFSGPNVPLASPYTTGLSRTERKFTFPDLPEVPDIVLTDGGDDHLNLEASEGSDYTLHPGGIGTGSERTLSQDFTDSAGSGGNGEHESVGTASQMSLPIDGRERAPFTWSRNSWSMWTIRGPSANSWHDVTIPFSNIQFSKQSLLGRGRFGEVHKGLYYGDVAVKFLNMDHVDEGKQLEAFKQEAASFKNTRHENIVLFMGYCMDHQKLGIVMNYCKGKTLHSILHQSRERLDFNRVVQYATQICQGVSYLHTKHILHKDLRTKNVFIEPNQKVVITDFGLFSMRRLCRLQENQNECKSLFVPEFWLCYLAPEIMQRLTSKRTDDLLPFTKKSDVYAFGTIWYELLTGEFPFKRFPPEAIVWQVGRGIKPALNNLHAAREIKDILMKCWAFQINERPDFNELFKILERLPKKRLVRSPSHPVHLSKSAESMF